MSDFLGIDVSGEEEIARKLKALPPAAQDMVTDEVSKYLINNILRIEPPKNYVTRRAAYGIPFFTDKQRRWFFANLNSGELKIPYNRTHGLVRGWKQEGSGRRSFLANETKGAEYVIGEKQSRHERLVGWLKVSETLKRHMKSIMGKTDGAIKKAIKKVGLS